MSTEETAIANGHRGGVLTRREIDRIECLTRRLQHLDERIARRRAEGFKDEHINFDLREAVALRWAIVRWSNRREAAAQHFRDAIKEMRGACEVSASSNLTANFGGVAEDCVTYAIGCAQGGIDLLISAMESMGKDVK